MNATHTLRILLATLALAGAAAGLISLAYELMQRHQAGKQQTIPQRDDGDLPEEHPRPGTGDQERPGSLLDKAGATLGAAGDLAGGLTRGIELLGELAKD